MLEVWNKEQKRTKKIDQGMSLIEINEEMFKIKWSIKRHCFANVRTLGLTDTLSTWRAEGILIYFALFERSIKH